MRREEDGVSSAVFSRRTGRELQVVTSQPSYVPNSVKISDARGQELVLNSNKARGSVQPESR